MANSLVLSNNNWVLSSSTSLPTGFMDAFYGNGLDGDLLVTGSYTITRESYYNNLTIQGGGEVKPNGYKIYVKNTLTINASGSLNDDGTDSTGQSGGAGIARKNFLLVLSSVGGAGGANSAGSNGGAVGVGAGVLNNSGLSPVGGTGGRPAPGTGTPGNGGTINGSAQNIWGSWMVGVVPAAAATSTTCTSWTGGSGGGGAASSGVGAVGGGGGGGAGMVWLAAKTINNSGRISANGGMGGPASGSGNAGSGGGGGGGNVVVITHTPVSLAGIIQANGGSSSTTVIGTGTTGSAGVSGPICVISFGGN
jgi:hypothetical protein